jgi:hypothetical protein
MEQQTHLTPGNIWIVGEVEDTPELWWNEDGWDREKDQPVP